MRRFGSDVRYLVSALLLVGALVSAVTGIVADVWDLNDFAPHTVSGYVMVALALAHTLFEMPLLAAYVRRRLRGQSRQLASGVLPRRSPAPAETAVRPQVEPGAAFRHRLTRRGLLGLLVGGSGGFLLGQVAAGYDRAPSAGDLGNAYHAWSKPSAASVLAGISDWGERPSSFKLYAQAERLQLPEPARIDALSTFDAIRQRRSIRDYGAAPVAIQDLSRLLYLAGGITAPRGRAGLRAAPSAGALYPIEIYVVVHAVAGLTPGLYHYAVQSHALERLRSADLRQECVRLGAMQTFLGEANVVLVLTAIFQRLRWRYKRRSYRYALLEAGHIGQNVYLAATSMGLGACAVGAYLDDGLNQLLGVDGDQEAALYMLAVGAR